MTTRLTRRTLLLSGAAVASVAAGGLWALNVSRPPAGRGMPDLENLPVAAVPEPTDQPVEVVYCAGWDSAKRAPVSPMSKSTARAQDVAGGQYAAVLLVSGVARAVVEVCWSAHHAEVWQVDDAGRRYRGVTYRRWPDGQLRLFEVRSWNYAGPDTPEFDGDEPTFQARVRRDHEAAITTVEILAVQSDGGTLQISRDWSDWPERVRPQENIAVPSVDGWPRPAGMTGPLTVHSGPDVVPATFPWREPRPILPMNVTEMVTEGMRLRTQDGRVLTITRLPAGTIRLPSGRLLVADPAWLDPDQRPLAARVPPGEYPVDVFQAAENGTPQTVACRVTVTGAPVTSWQLAMRDGDQELELGDGEYFGNPVDTATLSVVDYTGANAYDQDKIEAAMGSDDVYRTLSAKGTDLIIVPGWSDGANPTWLGRTEDGALSCFVLDFLVPNLATAQPLTN